MLGQCDESGETLGKRLQQIRATRDSFMSARVQAHSHIAFFASKEHRIRCIERSRPDERGLFEVLPFVSVMNGAGDKSSSHESNCTPTPTI
ncbi:hypothetical protein WG66_001540 [Moniliophthora roreri]|nr:hypothetical protein WG66_001540 [Moniliophthora roreri]